MIDELYKLEDHVCYPLVEMGRQAWISHQPFGNPYYNFTEEPQARRLKFNLQSYERVLITVTPDFSGLRNLRDQLCACASVRKASLQTIGSSGEWRRDYQGLLSGDAVIERWLIYSQSEEVS